MMTDLEIEAEVERRIAEIERDPSLRSRFDFDRSGDLDAAELDVIRRVLTLQVVQEDAAARGRPSAPPLEGVVGSRFSILGPLGEGGQGRTWLARDLVTGETVALKEMHLGRANDWKAIELFDREASTLRGLRHARIPRYVHTFHDTDRDGSARFFLAQEFVEGENLEQELLRKRYDGDEAIDILRQMLDVLDYLHRSSPPVIHRDIKPSNILRRKDGSLALIDFGAVQSIAPELMGGSTVVGTNGYMPLEQYMGRAVPATDLYALGATLIHLLSRRHPADLPFERNRVQFRDAVSVSPKLERILTRMLEPNVEDRYSRAREILEDLDRPDAPAVPAPQAAIVVTSPKGRVPISVVSTSSGVSSGALSEVAATGDRYALIGTSVMFMFVFGFAGATCHGFAACGASSDAVALTGMCPQAVAVLGENIRITPMTPGCGNHESHGGCTRESMSGQERKTIRISGDDAGAWLSFSATMSRGQWTIHRASFNFDDEEINVVECVRMVKPR